MEQKEFHDVVPIEEARKRLYSHFNPAPLKEVVQMDEALGRVVAEPILATMDVPPFDRALMDGYALRAADTFHADEEHPAELDQKETVKAGDPRLIEVGKGECAAIATGAPIPKGANAVVMVEYTDRDDGFVRVYRPTAPGENIMAAGSDIMRGETVLREGIRITPRETGVLAALGMTQVPVWKRPRVGILSTGDEVVEAGGVLEFGKIYDINARAIGDAVRENGGEPLYCGVVGDEREALLERLKGMMDYDIILTSGGTSAGVGDLLYRVIDEMGPPGILVHGVAIKPGKPVIIGVASGKPVFGLPGYPTSAMVVFDVFVAPLIREMAGVRERPRGKVEARAAMKLFSAKGRYEYMLVNLVKGEGDGYSAYPILTGSGAVTTLAEADGFVEIPEDVEMVEEGDPVHVVLLSEMIRPADITMIGSHCIGVDLILNLMNRTTPTQVKIMNAGSSGGLLAVRRGESDISGTHLIDEGTGVYNIPFLEGFKVAGKAYLVRGYDREQGLMVARGNPKGITGVGDLVREDVTFINRNQGSGTRVLLDLELGKLEGPIHDIRTRIKGYEIEAKSHSGVAAAVANGRADVGLGIRTVAEGHGLDFLPLREERYDFVIPADRMEKPAVKRFIQCLSSDEFRDILRDTPGLRTSAETGTIIHTPRMKCGSDDGIQV